ncbi:amidohydrolase family protein [Chloroflexi bacterium TSY]|nr:amidohydrolase family protein [Chloroflexi bacterium TSY]
MPTLIDGGIVVAFQEDGHRLIDGGQVVYDGQQITFVGRHYTGPANQRIDGRGKLVIPGFINHHMAFGIHMQFTQLDKAHPNFFNSSLGLGVQPEKAYNVSGPEPTDWQASARYAMTTALRTGTTTFVMVPNYGRHPYRGRVGTDQELVDCVAATGLRAYLALPHMSGGVVGKEDGTIEWVLREEAGWEGLEQAVDFTQTFNGAAEDRIRTILFPYQTDNCTPELLKATKAAAQELGCTLKIHVSQYLLDFHQVLRRYGRRPIQYLYEQGFLGPEVSLAHAIFTPDHPWTAYPADDQADTDLIVESGASVAHCPVVFARSGVALHSFSRYVRAGIPVSLGTDTSPHDMLMEMRTAALMSKLADADAASGTAREVFDAATLGGAKALQRDDIGRLAIGAKADIVLVDLEKIHIGPVAAHDPIKALVYCANGGDVDTVIVDGAIRIHQGEVVGVDLGALAADALRFELKLQQSVAQATYQGRSVSEFYEPAFPDWVE